MEESLGKCKTRHKLELKAWEKSKIALIKAAKKDKAKLADIENQEKTLLDRHKEELAKYGEQEAPPKTKGEDEEKALADAANRARAQKKKDKREAKEEERMRKADSTKYDEETKNSAGEQEKRKIEEKLSKRGLSIKEVMSRILLFAVALSSLSNKVPADGWCMFASISDQLGNVSPASLRKQAADFMRNHREDFEAFFEDFDGHVDKIENTSEWGGQAEVLLFCLLFCVVMCVC